MNKKEVNEKVKRVLLSMQRFSWEQGIAAQAFFESNDVEMGIFMAKEAVHRQTEDGRLAICGDRFISTDPGANGGPVLTAARLTGEKFYYNAAQRMADWFLKTAPRTDEGILYHYSGEGDENHKSKKYIVMIDAIYHIAPFLALMGYHKEACNQILGFKKLLFDPVKKLYHHQWDDNKKEFFRKDFWGGGNGWMACALFRVISELPETMNLEKQELNDHLKELIDSCITYQTNDGLFHDVIDDPATFVETTAALMIAYAIYHSVSGKLIGKEYLKYADKILDAAYRKVDEYGFVQGASNAPRFLERGTSPEAQSFLLLAYASKTSFDKVAFL